MKQSPKPPHLIRRKAASASKDLQVEALESRILYSAAPVEAPAATESETVAAAAPAAAEATPPAVTTPKAIAEPSPESGGNIPADGQSEINSNQNVTLVALDSDHHGHGDGTLEDTIEGEAAAGSLDAAAVEATWNEGISRWAESGASSDQLAVLQAATVEIHNLRGNLLAATSGNSVVVDDDGANRSWFVDPAGASTEVPADQIDLLSVLMHEQGHLLGLEHDADTTPDSIMFSVFQTGERRTISTGEADGAIAGSLEGVHFATTADDSAATNENTALNVSPGNDTLTNPAGGTSVLDNDPVAGTVVNHDPFSTNGAAVTVNSDGTFTYDPTGSGTIQALGEGQTLNDTFTYTSSSGGGFVYRPGLSAGSLTGNFDPGANPGNLGSSLGPAGALRDEGPRDAEREAHWTALTGDDGIQGPDNTTLVYTGQIYLPTGDTHFLEMIDDKTELTIAGSTVVSNSVWNQEGGGTFTNNTGSADWFDFDLRISNGGGGYGFFSQTWGGGISAGFLMKSGGAFSTDETLYEYPEDDGTMSLFRHLGPDPATSDTSTVTVTITGVNDAPVANDDGASITELANSTAANTVSGNVISNDTDVDDATSSLSATTIGTFNGIYGSLQLNSNGSYTYALHDNLPIVDALRTGEVVTDSFNYTVTDNPVGGNAKIDNGVLVITINGVNDSPVATDNTAEVTEDVAQTDSGNLITDDDGNGADSDGDHAQNTLTVTEIDGVSNPATDVGGTYGSLNWASDGSYTYTVDNSNPAVQALNPGDTLTDTFSYTLSDPYFTGDGLFNVSVFRAVGGGGSTDHDLNSMNETLGIWDRIDAGDTVPGPIIAGGQTYNIDRYETDTETSINYGPGNGNFNAGTLGTNSINSNGPGGSGGGINGGDDYSLRAQAYLYFHEAGTYSIATASDDGRRMDLTGVVTGGSFNGFSAQYDQVDGPFTPGQTFVIKNGTTGHDQSVGVFTVDAGDILYLDTRFFERAGGASPFEVMIKQGADTNGVPGGNNSDPSAANDGWRLLSEGVFGIAVSTANNFTQDANDTATLTVTIQGGPTTSVNVDGGGNLIIEDVDPGHHR